MESSLYVKNMMKKISSSVESDNLTYYLNNKSFPEKFVRNVKLYVGELVEQDFDCIKNRVSSVKAGSYVALNIRDLTHYDCFAMLLNIDPVFAYNIYEEEYNEYISLENYYELYPKHDYKEVSSELLELMKNTYKEQFKSILPSLNLDLIYETKNLVFSDTYSQEEDISKNLNGNIFICKLSLHKS